MNEIYRIALSEIYAVLLYMEQETFDKIPFEIVYKITANKSEDYVLKIDENKEELANVIENKLGEEAREILALLYLKYWCEDEKLKEEINAIEEVMKIEGIYDIFTLDLKKVYIEDNQDQAVKEENSMVVYKDKEERFLKKIKNMLFRFFKRNNYN